MKRLILGILALLFALHLQAQEEVDCASAASQASTVIASAQDLLEEGNTQGASTLLDAARNLLDNCSAGEANPQASNTPSDNPENLPTATVAISATLAPTPNTSQSTGSFTLTAPPIDENSGIAFLRFAHTSVDAGPIDIYMGRDNLLVVSNLHYGEATDFITIQAGERSFQARRHGAGADSEVLYQVSWNYLGNSSWILTAAGLADEFAFIVEPISVIRNDYDEQARVRVVNWVAGAPRLTVNTESGLVLGNGLGWVGIRDTMLAAGTYQIQASTNNGGSLPEALSFDFEANKTYTLYVMGRGTAESPLHILNIVSDADVTHIRFSNNSSAAVDIHYRPGNARLVENLATGIQSEWTSLFSGSYTFISYAPNTGPTGQELAAIAIQLRPQRYMVFELVGNSINLVYEGLNPPPNE